MSRRAVPVTDENVQLSMRVHPNVVTDADSLIPYLSGLRGAHALRVDVVREALVIGLRELKRLSAACPEPTR